MLKQNLGIDVPSGQNNATIVTSPAIICKTDSLLNILFMTPRPKHCSFTRCVVSLI